MCVHKCVFASLIYGNYFLPTVLSNFLGIKALKCENNVAVDYVYFTFKCVIFM